MSMIAKIALGLILPSPEFLRYNNQIKMGADVVWRHF
jgi:hypothetical protein